MIKIRAGTFETNSSSTHSLIICTKEVFNALKNEDPRYLIDECEDKVVEIVPKTNEEIEKKAKEKYNETKNKFWKDWSDLSEDCKKSWIKESGILAIKNDSGHGLISYDEWMYGDSLETFSEEFITPSGDKMVVFGKYGYD